MGAGLQGKINQKMLENAPHLTHSSLSKWSKQHYMHQLTLLRALDGVLEVPAPIKESLKEFVASERNEN